MSIYSPPLENILQFNTSLFQSASTTLTLADADLRYCKNNNGYITGSLNVIGPIYGTVLNIDSALVLDNNASIRIGYNNTAKNYIDLAFNYVSSGSDTNYLSIGGLKSFVNNTIGINTINPYSSMDINNSTGKNLRLIYNDATGSPTKYTDLITNINGDLEITNQRYTNITNHNGTSAGLALAGVLITASATDINAITGIGSSLSLISGITPGTLAPSKALTYDANGRINSKLYLNEASGDNLRLIYNGSTNYVDLQTTGGGDLTITPSGGNIVSSSILNINNTQASVSTLTGAINCLGGIYTAQSCFTNGKYIMERIDENVISDASDAGEYDILLRRESTTVGLRCGIAFQIKQAPFTNSVPQISMVAVRQLANKADLLICTNSTGNTCSEKIRIISDGYMGINSSNPMHRLEINETDGHCLRLSYNNTLGGNLGKYVDFCVNASGDLNILPYTASTFRRIGINTTAPDRTLEINSVDGNCLRLTYNDSTGTATNYSDITVSSTGNLILHPSSDIVQIDDSHLYLQSSDTHTLNSSTKANLYDILIHRQSALTPLSAGIAFAVSVAAPAGLVPDASIIFTDTTATKGSMTFNTKISGATCDERMRIDDTGFIGINTTLPGKQCCINNSTGQCLRLSYNAPTGTATYYNDFLITSAGTLTITNQQYTNISNHNGSTLGLQLGGTLITSTAAKLNYTDIATLGTAQASKCLTADANLDVQTIRNLKITGSLGIDTTAPDRKVEINDTSGNCLRLTYNDNNGTATYFNDFLVSSAGTLSITNQAFTDITNHDGSTKGLKLGGTLITSTAAKLNYTNITTLGTAEASKCLTLDASSKLNSGITELNTTTLKCTNLYVNSTQITTTPAVINSLSGLTASSTELNYNDITTLGTVQSSKTITVASDGWITGRIMTIANGFGFSQSSGAGGTEIITVSNGLVGAIGTYTNHPFQFYQNNSNRMALQTTGSLFNIGSTAGQSYYVGNWAQSNYWGFGPDSALASTIGAHICSSLGAYVSYAPMKMSKLYIGSSGDTDTSRFITCLDSAMLNSTSRFICFGKAASVDNQAEISYFHVADGSTSNSLAFGFYGSERMRLLATGSFGIGTNLPVKKLSINDASGGSIRLVYNNTLGTETVYNDFLLNSSGDLTITNQRYTNISNHNGSTLGLQLGGTLITATATELNVLDGITASTTELNYTDISTLGVAQASKCITADANIDITTIRNMRLTGNIGIGTTAADLACEINHATGQCLRLTYNDNNGSATNWSNLTTTASGSLSLDSTTHRVNIGNGTISTCNLTITGDTGTTNSSRQTPLRIFNSGGEGIDFSVSSTYAMLQTISNADLRFGVDLSYNSKLTITKTTGRVGINLDAPDYQFHVSGTSKVSKLLVGTSTDDARLISALDSTMISGSIRWFTLGYANSDRNQAEIGYEHILDSSNGNSMIFGFHSKECMRLKSNGYFGIGTNNPVIGLHVNAYASFYFSSFGYFNSGGNHGTSSGTNDYSGYFDKRLAAQEFNAISDRREKENFKDIKFQKAIDFINKCEPKKYNYIGETAQNYGYVAQDILKEGFNNLINLVPAELEETIDDDGFVSPKGAKFVLQYNSIIPLLHTVIKQQQKDINDIRNMLFDSQLKAYAETEKNKVEIDKLKTQIKNIVFIIEEINKK